MWKPIAFPLLCTQFFPKLFQQAHIQLLYQIKLKEYIPFNIQFSNSRLLLLHGAHMTQFLVLHIQSLIFSKAHTQF